jgi:membrane protein YdbS with pleckstrin-like domain
MNRNAWIRQIHRWLAVVFTLTVVVTTVALVQEEPVVWVFSVPLFPLALLMASGLYLFVLPHVARWRGARRDARLG